MVALISGKCRKKEEQAPKLSDLDWYIVKTNRDKHQPYSKHAFNMKL